MMSNRDLLSLYKILLRESKKFESYNIREYFTRRVKDGFRENVKLTEPAKIEHVQQEARDLLDVLKRQVVIYNMYSPGRLVIEKS